MPTVSPVITASATSIVADSPFSIHVATTPFGPFWSNGIAFAGTVPAPAFAATQYRYEYRYDRQERVAFAGLQLIARNTEVASITTSGQLLPGRDVDIAFDQPGTYHIEAFWTLETVLDTYKTVKTLSRLCVFWLCDDWHFYRFEYIHYVEPFSNITRSPIWSMDLTVLPKASPDEPPKELPEPKTLALSLAALAAIASATRQRRQG